MMEVEKLETTLTVNDRQLRQGLNEAQRLTRDYAGKMDSILSGVGQGFGRSGFLDTLSNISNVISALPAIGSMARALVSPLTDAAKAGIMFNATLESAQASFTGIIGDSDRALAHLNKLQSFAEKTPFEFTGLLKSSRYMTTFGFQITEHIPKLTAWGNAIAASGELSEETLMGVVRAFGQMTAKGRTSAEEMEQLAERGIPSWELLSKAIGKSVEETRKLSEQGRLKGRESMEAITAMMRIDPRFANQMEIQSHTLLGLMSNAEDLKARSLGLGTRGLTADIKGALEAGLSQSGTAEAIAASVNAAIKPVSGLVKAAAVGLLGGGITSGLIEGINAGKGMVEGAISDLGLGTIRKFAALFGIESPSTVFKEFGINIAEGLNLGLQLGMQETEDEWKKLIDAMLSGSQSSYEAVRRNLAKLEKEEPGFTKEVEAMAGRLRTKPEYLMNVMAFESGFDPKAKNPQGSAGGLFQATNETAHNLGAGSSAFLRSLPGIRQLEYFERYLQPFSQMNQLGSQADVYSAVFRGKVKPGGLETTVLQRGERDAKGRDMYAPNKGLDFNSDARISKLELALAAYSRGRFGSITDIFAGADIQGGAWSSSNPLPVEVVGGYQPSARELDSVGGFGGDSWPAGWPKPSGKLMDGINLPSSAERLGVFNLDEAVYRNTLKWYEDIGVEVRSVAHTFEETQPGIGEWWQIVSGSGIDVYKNLRRIENQIPRLSEQLKGVASDAPHTIGGIFGDAARNSDGTLKGFGRTIALGFADAMRETGAQMLENAITKGASQIMQSIFKPSEKDVVAALDKSFMFTPLEDGFGFNTTAVTINTSSTDLNTLALNQLSASMQLQGTLGSGGSESGGWLGSILGAAAAAFGSLGGAFTSAGSSAGSGMAGIFPLARGGFVPAMSGGKLIQVAEGGFSEMVLSTDPKYKDRTAGLLARFIDKTNIVPKFAAGGWADAASWRDSVASLALDRSDHSFNYTPNYSQQNTNQYGSRGDTHHHHYSITVHGQVPTSYHQPKAGDRMLENLAREITRVQRQRGG